MKSDMLEKSKPSYDRFHRQTVQHVQQNKPNYIHKINEVITKQQKLLTLDQTNQLDVCKNALILQILREQSQNNSSSFNQSINDNIFFDQRHLRLQNQNESFLTSPQSQIDSNNKNIHKVNQMFQYPVNEDFYCSILKHSPISTQSPNDRQKNFFQPSDFNEEQNDQTIDSYGKFNIRSLNYTPVQSKRNAENRTLSTSNYLKGVTQQPSTTNIFNSQNALISGPEKSKREFQIQSSRTNLNKSNVSVKKIEFNDDENELCSTIHESLATAARENPVLVKTSLNFRQKKKPVLHELMSFQGNNNALENNSGNVTAKSTHKSNAQVLSDTNCNRLQYFFLEKQIDKKTIQQNQDQLIDTLFISGTSTIGSCQAKDDKSALKQYPKKRQGQVQLKTEYLQIFDKQQSDLINKQKSKGLLLTELQSLQSGEKMNVEEQRTLFYKELRKSFYINCENNLQKNDENLNQEEKEGNKSQVDLYKISKENYKNFCLLQQKYNSEISLLADFGFQVNQTQLLEKNVKKPKYQNPKELSLRNSRQFDQNNFFGHQPIYTDPKRNNSTRIIVKKSNVTQYLNNTENNQNFQNRISQLNQSLYEQNRHDQKGGQSIFLNNMITMEDYTLDNYINQQRHKDET